MYLTCVLYIRDAGHIVGRNMLQFIVCINLFHYTCVRLFVGPIICHQFIVYTTSFTW